MTRPALSGCAALLLLGIAQAAAQQPDSQPDPGGGPATQQSPVPGPADPTASTLLGDVLGVRPYLARYGVSIGLQETSEVFGNPIGGTRRTAHYNGLTTMALGIDTGKAFGIQGGILNASAFQIHGRNISAENLGTLQTASGIEAQRATRLWELWYQQAFLGGKLDVKIGQQSLDTEFITSQGSGLFINTAMGWPLLPSVNLYAGGPAYPLSSLGVRVRTTPIDTLTILAGVFDDNPPGGPFFDDGQVRGASQSGTKFHTGTGALFIGELQYSLNAPAPGRRAGLPGVYKLGFWYDSGTFYDQRFDAAGLPLADPASGGPKARRGNYSVYGVFDQLVWQPDPEGPRAVGVFARLMGSPGNRNLASFSVNAGVTLKAPFASRPNDSVGLGYGLAKISSRAIQANQDADLANGPYPVRGSESFLELTYQCQITPWWTVQPDAQYVWTPGGGVPDPGRPGKRIGNSVALGLRTNLVF